jgi:NAD(P)-dependent dehydrogenase (short-subunit alcohol dehydrogenase family)
VIGSHAFLDGRVVIVTGAGSGLGASHLTYLADAGAAVVAVDTPGTVGAAAIVAQLCDRGALASWFDGDISTWSGAQAAVDHAVTEFGVLHALVNTAGVLRDRSVAKITEDDWDVSLTSNLKTCASMTVAAVAYWRARGDAPDLRPSIVNRTSTSVLVGQPFQFNYCAAMAGIIGATVATARELEPYGIRVNALCGPLDPAALDRLLSRSAEMPSGTALGLDARQQDDFSEGEREFDIHDYRHLSPVVGYLVSEIAAGSTSTTTDTCRRSSATSSRRSLGGPDTFCSFREGGSAT